MPIQLKEENDGRNIIAHVSGKLAKSDYEQLLPTLDRLVRLHGKVRVLFEMVDFHGWDAGGAWQDLKFGIAHFANIERLALVGETQWQHRMATFAKPFTRATVRYFDHADAALAHEWLEEGQTVSRTGSAAP